MPSKTDSAELSMRRWASLQFHVRWAYRGAPVLMHTQATKNDSVSAWLIEKGSVRLVMDGHARRVGAGQWVVFPPGQVAFEFSENAQILSVSFYAAWIDGQPLFDLDEPTVAPANRFPNLLRVSGALADFVGRRFPEAVQFHQQASADLETFLRLQVLSQRWLAAMAKLLTANTRGRDAEPADPRAATARQMIDLNTPAVPFVERALPKQLGISSSHLDRIFVTAFGQTPRAYAERCRLTWAKQALVSQDVAVKQVALRLGFRYPSHFTHWFQKLAGQTPRDYRATTGRQRVA